MRNLKSKFSIDANTDVHLLPTNRLEGTEIQLKRAVSTLESLSNNSNPRYSPIVFSLEHLFGGHKRNVCYLTSGELERLGKLDNAGWKEIRDLTSVRETRTVVKNLRKYGVPISTRKVKRDGEKAHYQYYHHAIYALVPPYVSFELLRNKNTFALAAYDGMTEPEPLLELEKQKVLDRSATRLCNLEVMYRFILNNAPILKQGIK